MPPGREGQHDYEIDLGGKVYTVNVDHPTLSHHGPIEWIYIEDNIPFKRPHGELHLVQSGVVEGGKANTFVDIGIKASFIGNVFLFCVKITAALTTGSMTVIASCIESMLDILALFIIFFTSCMVTHQPEKSFPGGKTKFEPISLVVFATFMCTSALQLIVFSIQNLLNGPPKEPAEPHEWFVGVILALTVALKLVLYGYCSVFARESDSVKSLRDDHRNDAISNAFALVVVMAAESSWGLWWLDDGGAVCIAAYICFNWILTLQEQIRYLSGYTAEPEFYDRAVALAHSSLTDRGQLDAIRAYHFGPRFLVELDVILENDVTITEAYGLLDNLKGQVIQLEEVNKCFVSFKFKTHRRLSHPPREGEVIHVGHTHQRVTSVGRGQINGLTLTTEPVVEMDEPPGGTAANGNGSGSGNGGRVAVEMAAQPTSQRDSEATTSREEEAH